MPLSRQRSHKRSNRTKISRKSMRSKRVSKKKRSVSKKNLKRTQKGGLGSNLRSNFKFNPNKINKTTINNLKTLYNEKDNWFVDGELSSKYKSMIKQILENFGHKVEGKTDYYMKTKMDKLLNKIYSSSNTDKSKYSKIRNMLQNSTRIRNIELNRYDRKIERNVFGEILEAQSATAVTPVNAKKQQDINNASKWYNTHLKNENNTAEKNRLFNFLSGWYKKERNYDDKFLCSVPEFKNYDQCRQSTA